MLVHNLPALGDMLLLLLQLLGLLGELLRSSVDLSRLLLDNRLPAFEARLVARQEPLLVGELSLPVDELLAEAGDGEAVLVLTAAKLLCLLIQSLGVRLHGALEVLQI